VPTFQHFITLLFSIYRRAVLTFSDLEKVPLADGYSFGTIISIVEDELNPGAYLFGTLSNVALLTANKTIHMVAGKTPCSCCFISLMLSGVWYMYIDHDTCRHIFYHYFLYLRDLCAEFPVL